VDVPAATHAPAEVHDTPISSLAFPSAVGSATALGVRWIDHVEPFQRSAKVAPLTSPLTTPEEPPTAVHALADVHDTPLKKESWAAGLGVRWTDHLEPFQRSSSGLFPSDPTTTRARGEVRDTALSEPPGLGVRWIDQRDPFQRSTSAVLLPAASTNDPTATHTLRDVHDTARR
jgi:hypothetical protein